MHLTPDLFPDVAKYPQHFQRREYVKQRIVDMARDGSLSLTACFQMTPGVLELIGQVIMGHDFAGNRQIQGRPVPPELLNYKVRIESTQGRPIRYKAGLKPQQMMYRRVGNLHRAGVLVQVDDYQYPCGEDATEGEVSLQDAWRILMQAGEDCYFATSQRLQKVHWHYREVLPEEPKSVMPEPDKPTAKKKPGRPAKYA